MKTKLISLLAGGCFLLLLGSSTYGQEEQQLPPVTVTATTNVSKAVTKSFDKTFKDAENTQWFKVNRRYLVYFISNDQKNRALYQKNGALIYHLMYGTENNLPDDVRKIVKSNYVDYDITHAINVHQENRNIWVVNLEDKKKLILVRIEDGALEEVGNYDKSL